MHGMFHVQLAYSQFFDSHYPFWVKWYINNYCHSFIYFTLELSISNESMAVCVSFMISVLRLRKHDFGSCIHHPQIMVIIYITGIGPWHMSFSNKIIYLLHQ